MLFIVILKKMHNSQNFRIQFLMIHERDIILEPLRSLIIYKNRQSDSLFFPILSAGIDFLLFFSLWFEVKREIYFLKKIKPLIRIILIFRRAFMALLSAKPKSKKVPISLRFDDRLISDIKAYNARAGIDRLDDF